MLESRIEKKAVKALAEEGFETVKCGEGGFPDRLVIVGPGRHIWFEFKQPGGKLTKAQVRRLPAMMERGEIVYTVKSDADAVAYANRHRTLL